VCLREPQKLHANSLSLRLGGGSWKRKAHEDKGKRGGARPFDGQAGRQAGKQGGRDRCGSGEITGPRSQSRANGSTSAALAAPNGR
jgi:hypothetical protein